MKEIGTRYSKHFSARGVLGLAGIVIAFMAISVVGHVRESQEVLLQRLQDRADDLGSLVADFAASHLEERRVFELNTMMQDVAARRGVELAHIIDQEGEIVADGNDDRKTLFPVSKSPVVAEALANGEKVFTHGAGFVDAAIPVTRGEEVIGAVHVKISIDVGEMIGDALTRGLIFALMPITLVVVLCRSKR